MVTTEEALTTGITPPVHRPKESIFKIVIQATRATIVLALLTGIAFPMAITGIGQVIFPGRQTDRSLATAPVSQSDRL